ncbi:preprotein translocase subunit SecG [Candidatus Omnitrophota bacterium]
MMIFVIVIHVIACLTLISVILLQAGRGHGLAGSSFGSEMSTVFGARTAKFMTKATSVCAILFLVTCLTIDVMIAKRSRSLLSDDIKEGLTQEQIDEVMAKLNELKEEGGTPEDMAALKEEVAGVTTEVEGVVAEMADVAQDVAEAVVEEESAAVDSVVENAQEDIPEVIS